MNGSVAPPVLPPRYYLENFHKFVATVEQQYRDILTENERAFLSTFADASEILQCLYVRLVSRRGPLFRAEALHYPELGDLTAALAEGLRCGLLQQPEKPDFAHLARLLRKAELETIYAEHLPSQAGLRKPELIQLLVSSLDQDQLLIPWKRWRSAQCALVQPMYTEVIVLLRLLFFGNDYQDLTEFVVSDLGYTQHASYPLDPEYRLFKSRQEVDEYLELSALKTLMKEAAIKNDRGTLVALGRRLRESASGSVTEGVRDRLRLRLARQFEREGLYREARELYQRCGLHPARQRLTRLLAEREPKTALALCEKISADPWCEAERDFARRSRPTLAKRLGHKVSPLPRDRFDEDRLALPKPKSVERAAALHYLEGWPEAHHLENLLFNASFGLAFWQEIFLPVAGAFINPFQAAPLDMYTPRFERSRRVALRRRLDHLSQCDLADTLLATYEQQQGITNSWVAWRAGLRSVLETALRTVPRQHWLAIWQRMLFDPEANRNGFPDLLLLNPGHGYRLVEVKGPGDQLQANQRRWLRFFQTAGIPAGICWVSWTDA
ncbi:MAG: VRR-NUC domain-containing protein [Pseudomonadota bacterium]